MRRTVLTLFGTLALLFSFTASAGAQDADCPDFGGDQAAAQAYFEAGGGSVDFNYNNLDGDGDGIACEVPGSGGGGVSNPSEPVSGNTGDGVAAELPATGSGPMGDVNASSASLLAGSALLLAGISLFLRRTAIDRS